MYLHHFGLHQPPFKITPDVRMFFSGGKRGAILDALIYAIVNGEGIVKVVGEVGSGKTMLCRMLQVELPDHVEIVYLVNPSIAPEHVLHALALEMKLAVKLTDDRFKVMHKLQEALLKKHAANRRVVLFVEEAQGMPVATLEELRLLTNLETSYDKLLQIVLFGQPELDNTLNRYDIRQLRERITHHFNLPPLDEQEIRDYMNARLSASGYRGSGLFSEGAVKELARVSQGLMRRVNILADKALLAGYANADSEIKRRHVVSAARDSEFGNLRAPSLHWWKWLLGAAASLLVGVWAYWQFIDPRLLAPSIATTPASGSVQAVPAVGAAAAPTVTAAPPSTPEQIIHPDGVSYPP